MKVFALNTVILSRADGRRISQPEGKRSGAIEVTRSVAHAFSSLSKWFVAGDPSTVFAARDDGVVYSI